jgi:hypothetical protein
MPIPVEKAQLFTLADQLFECQANNNSIAQILSGSCMEAAAVA